MLTHQEITYLQVLKHVLQTMKITSQQKDYIFMENMVLEKATYFHLSQKHLQIIIMK